MEYVALAAIIAGLSLIPAFGPPSWIALVALYVQWHLALVPAVIVAAFSTTAGRMVLARGTRLVRRYLSASTRLHLAALGATIRRRRAGALFGIGLFLVSPFPSAQLWEGAGLLRLPLVPLGVAFAFGRMITFTFYLSAAHLAAEPLGDLITAGVRSPISIAVNAVLLLLLVGISRIHWLQILNRKSGDPEPRDVKEPAARVR
jgi:hypothetical protein